VEWLAIAGVAGIFGEFCEADNSRSHRKMACGFYRTGADSADPNAREHSFGTSTPEGLVDFSDVRESAN
jgi:hypothetical protein